MKRMIVFIFFIGFVFFGCSKENLNEQHEQYLLNNCWQINKFLKERTYLLNIPDELLNNYEASGITFLRNYEGMEVTQFIYELKEKDIEGANLQAIVYEFDDSIIGGYGVLPNWTPGIFALENKTYLIERAMIKNN